MIKILKWSLLVGAGAFIGALVDTNIRVYKEIKAMDKEHTDEVQYDIFSEPAHFSEFTDVGDYDEEDEDDEVFEEEYEEHYDVCEDEEDEEDDDDVMNLFDLPEEDVDEYIDKLCYSEYSDEFMKEEFIVYADAARQIFFEQGSEEERDRLKYKLDDVRAWLQYCAYRCSDISRPYILECTLRLMNVPWKPTVEVDRLIEQHIYDEREEFFGVRYDLKPISLGEVLLHFSNLLTFDLDRDNTYWMEILIRDTEMGDLGSDFGTLLKVSHAISKETYWKNGSFGIFKLKNSETKKVGLMAQYHQFGPFLSEIG